jgi:hypothetical protein
MTKQTKMNKNEVAQRLLKKLSSFRNPILPKISPSAIKKIKTENLSELLRRMRRPSSVSDSVEDAVERPECPFKKPKIRSRRNKSCIA